MTDMREALELALPILEQDRVWTLSCYTRGSSGRVEDLDEEGLAEFEPIERAISAIRAALSAPGDLMRAASAAAAQTETWSPDRQEYARRVSGTPQDGEMPPLCEGHGQPCYYCGKPCSSLSGNPGKWPIPLCHRDDPGKVVWHHERCVTERLVENQAPQGGEAANDVSAIYAALGLFQSVIKCGEPWTPACAEANLKARDALKRLTATPPPPAIGEAEIADAICMAGETDPEFSAHGHLSLTRPEAMALARAFLALIKAPSPPAIRESAPSVVVQALKEAADRHAAHIARIRSQRGVPVKEDRDFERLLADALAVINSHGNLTTSPSGE